MFARLMMRSGASDFTLHNSEIYSLNVGNRISSEFCAINSLMLEVLNKFLNKALVLIR